MKRFGLDGWRLLFIVSALLILAGGPRHPDGTMEEMLGHPDWVPAHLLLLGGFIALLAGLRACRRRLSMPDRTHAWMRLALIGTFLQAMEMALHTAAVVDHANLVAGRSTPVLTAHLGLAIVVYPIFGVTAAGLIVAGARDRVLGSPWIAWLGVLGAAAHGLAAPLVGLLAIEGARVLFPLLMLFAVWLVLAALWPSRRVRGEAAQT